MMNRLSAVRLSCSVFLWCGVCVSGAVSQENPFHAPVLDVRPRILLRQGGFEGLTVAKLRESLSHDELRDARSKWRSRPLGRALLWLIEGNRQDRDAALEAVRGMDATEGSWSDRGLALSLLATLFDWLYDELNEADRAAVIARIERAADDAAAHIRQGGAPFFYSRTPGALAGLCVAGLALHGVSDKAAEYLELFRRWGVDEYFRAYDWLDGAATGATYTFFYTYVDLPQICAAWWSATGENPHPWLRDHQGDWLNDIVLFYLWYMRPGFAFTDINDQSRDQWDTHDQFCQGLDIASYVTRNGHGRAWSQRWWGRFGTALYHPAYAHNLIFRDPSLPPRPLTELPLAALFGRDSCGYAFFRSHWPDQNQPDTATHVFFRCGDPVNVHGSVAAGEFQVFKYAPLAARGGRYASYDSPADQYHRNCISTNVVLFTDPQQAADRGDQLTRSGLKTDHATWDQWIALRERHGMDVASITDWQVREGESRCRADLTRTNPAEKCAQWIREFVWLANRHLLVLDIVEAVSPQIRRQWQLHSPTVPEIGDRLVTIQNAAPDQRWADPRLQPKNPRARLFCQTLLPEDYVVIVHGEDGATSYTASGQLQGSVEGNMYHRQFGRHVLQFDPGTDDSRNVFLHVMTAVEAVESTPPAVSWRVLSRGKLEVKVNGIVTQLTVPDWFGM